MHAPIVERNNLTDSITKRDTNSLQGPHFPTLIKVPWVEGEKTLNCTMYLQEQTPQHLQLTPSLALWFDILSNEAFRDHRFLRNIL
jgi:hypothetical protein